MPAIAQSRPIMAHQPGNRRKAVLRSSQENPSFAGDGHRQQVNDRVAQVGNIIPHDGTIVTRCRATPATIGHTARLTVPADQPTIKRGLRSRDCCVEWIECRMNIARLNRVSTGRSRILCQAILPAVLVAWSLVVVGQSEDIAQDAPSEKSYERAVLIRFEGPITPLLEHFVFRKLEIGRAHV